MSNSINHPLGCMNGFDWYACRPADSSLDVIKVSGYKKPLTVMESLDRFHTEWKEKKLEDDACLLLTR
jgi:hypothetical protein